MFDIRFNLKDDVTGLSPVIKRISDSITYSLMDAGDLEELNRQFKLNIFYTDRVYVDPHFTREQAAQRYIGWANDLVVGGAKAYKCMLKDKPVGFFISKFDGEENDVVFVGVYSEYAQSGLGLGVIVASLREGKETGAAFSRGSVSSNNMPSMTSHLAIGYRITGAACNYVKHNNGAAE
jgi:hypothetical protein